MATSTLLRRRSLDRNQIVLVAVIATLAVVGAIDTGRYSTAVLLAKRNPQSALQLRPNLPAAIDTIAAQNIDAVDKLTASSRSQVAALAKASLMAAPINPVALRLYALTGSDDPARATRLMNLAYQLSRRDIGVQLAMIELNVTKGNITGALRHYDQSLRVTTNLDDLLFPILLSASTDPGVRPGVGRVIAADPPWLPRLIAWGTTNPDHLAPIAGLLQYAPANSPALSIDQAPDVIDVLVGRSEFDAAYMAYRIYRRAGLGLQSVTSLRPFDWAPVTGEETGADPTDMPGRFRIYAPAQQGGEVLHRLVRVNPGRYRLDFTIADTAVGGTLKTEIACTAAPVAAGSLSVSMPIAERSVSVPFEAGPGCRFAWIRLFAQAGSESLDVGIGPLSFRQRR